MKAPDGITDVAFDVAPDTGDNLFGDDDHDVIAGDDALVRWDGTVAMTAAPGPGNFGDDDISGGDGQDRLYGQLGGDTITGDDDDEDYVVGDLGFITPGTPTGTWPGGAPVYDVKLDLAPDLGSADDLDGGVADDTCSASPTTMSSAVRPATTTSRATAARTRSTAGATARLAAQPTRMT